jgi:hypothetical protein
VTARCLYCGRSPVQWHHVTGRPTPGAPYLDPALVVPLCKRHHDREHELLRRQGLEFLAPGAELLGHRRARLVDLVGRCAEDHRPFVLDACALAGLHALLLEAAAGSPPRWEAVAG